jgi:ubiquinone/menaquinone biosynthesis C-methylase UbiE
MREILRSKNHSANYVIEDSIERVPADSCDVALMCTVLHELSDIPGMVREARRVLKRSGSLAIIEFHKALTPMGPPVVRRISEPEATKVMLENGFMLTDRFELGENFYCLVFNQMKEG